MRKKAAVKGAKWKTKSVSVFSVFVYGLLSDFSSGS